MQQVTIRRLAGEALYGDITLDRGGRRRQVEARPGDGVALALLTGAPIRIVVSVLEAAGFDPADRQQQDLREELELARLRRRLAGRAGPPPPSPVAPPPPLDPQVRQQVEDGLERLRGRPWRVAGAAHPPQRHAGRLGRPGRATCDGALLPGPRRPRRRPDAPADARGVPTGQVEAVMGALSGAAVAG